MRSWPHFTYQELRCKHCGQEGMDEAFMQKLENLRLAYGRPMVVTSAYRCPAHNAAVSSTGSSGPHTTGRAVDIKVYGEHAVELIGEAISLGIKGIGVQQKGAHESRFIHLDDLRPRMWTY